MLYYNFIIKTNAQLLLLIDTRYIFILMLEYNNMISQP